LPGHSGFSKQDFTRLAAICFLLLVSMLVGISRVARADEPGGYPTKLPTNTPTATLAPTLTFTPIPTSSPTLEQTQKPTLRATPTGTLLNPTDILKTLEAGSPPPGTQPLSEFWVYLLIICALAAALVILVLVAVMLLKKTKGPGPGQNYEPPQGPDQPAG
jgi:hypothetical protein